MLFQVLLVLSAPHTNRRCHRFIQHQAGDIVVALEFIPKTVALIEDVFFHYTVLRV